MILKIFAKIFLFIILLNVMLFVNAESPDFYVWQRIYTKPLNSAIQEFYQNTTNRLYFLAGEMENNGKCLSVTPSSVVDLSRSTPVIRIHIKHMNKSVGDLSKEICKLYEPHKAAKALQIDLDAPESKLDYYRDLMLELRKKLPNTTLSATVLPCHLKHTQEFLQFASACDFYVLQVHGLTKESGSWSIYNHKIAKKALASAKKINKQFKVALPMYANLLSSRQLVQPNLYEVAELAKQCDEIIVFRLGFSENGQSLDRKTSTQICNGKYSPKIDFHWEKKNDNLWYLYVENSGFFADMVSIELIYDDPSLDMDIFNFSVLSNNKLLFLLPPSGVQNKILWVRCNDNQDVSKIITVKLED
ncbi:MAG: DUF3142 domain-containing protein [Kiritimatiellae bacterium]|nr:DUF3142 domain-containing protein [Kiritimatiellia bacterium]